MNATQRLLEVKPVQCNPETTAPGTGYFAIVWNAAGTHFKRKVWAGPNASDALQWIQEMMLNKGMTMDCDHSHGFLRPGSLMKSAPVWTKA